MFLVYIDGFMSSNPHGTTPGTNNKGCPPHFYGTNNKGGATPTTTTTTTTTTARGAPPSLWQPTTTTMAPTPALMAPPLMFYGTNNKGRPSLWHQPNPSWYPPRCSGTNNNNNNGTPSSLWYQPKPQAPTQSQVPTTRVGTNNKGAMGVVPGMGWYHCCCWYQHKNTI